VAPGGRCYLHYPLSYRLYCPDRPDHVLRRYEHSLGEKTKSEKTKSEMKLSDSGRKKHL
jgi:hypothetical protein